MFMLRHYGQDGEGRRTTINYFRATAHAGGAGDAAAAAGVGSVAEVGATSVRTVGRGRGAAEGRALRDDRLASELAGFGGVTLDAEAEAAINAALEACAARTRAADAAIEAGGDAAADALADDPAEPFVRLGANDLPYRGVLEPALCLVPVEGFAAHEPDWRHAGDDDPRVAVEAAVASVKRAKRRSNWDRGAAARDRPGPDLAVAERRGHGALPPS